MAKHKFTRGETFIVALENMDNATVSSVSSVLKRAGPDGNPTGEPVATFDVLPQVSLGQGLQGGWHFVLTADKTILLEPGNYCMDARLQVGSSIYLTELLRLEVKPGATEVAP